MKATGRLVESEFIPFMTTMTSSSNIRELTGRMVCFKNEKFNSLMCAVLVVHELVNRKLLHERKTAMRVLLVRCMKKKSEGDEELI